MTKQTLTVKLTFTEPILGTVNANPELHKEWIASKAPTPEKKAEEAALVEKFDADEEMEKITTAFHSDEAGLFLFNYMIVGFLKESIGVLIELGELAAKGLSKYTYKRAVDSCLFVDPRRVRLLNAQGEPIMKCTEVLSRPIRVDTMRGPRVAISSSQMLPAGTRCEFSIWWFLTSNPKSSMKISEELVKAALDYGACKGIGQWRGGSMGRFSYEQGQSSAK